MKKTIFIAIAVISILGTGCLVREQQRVAALVSANTAAPELRIIKELTEEDIKLILKNEELLAPPLSINELKNSSEKRQEYLQQLRGILALAAEARREGLDAKPEFEILRKMGEKATLAYIYPSREQNAKPMEEFVKITKEEIQEFYKNPKNEEQFSLEVNTQLAARHAMYIAENKSDAQIPVPTLQGENSARAHDRWARAAIVAEKARADAEFMQKPEVQLQLKLQEARLLASQYSSLSAASKIEPTNEEVAAYLTAHPEYDIKKKFAKAEMALQRAKAGGDFARLVKEYNELILDGDASGLYKDVEDSAFPNEVKEVVITLEKGKVAERLIETFDGYNIIKLEDKKVVKDETGKETIKFTVRQILVRNKFQAPTNNNALPAPFEEAETIAKDAVKEEKRKRLKEEIAQRNGIIVPEDITI